MRQYKLADLVSWRGVDWADVEVDAGSASVTYHEVRPGMRAIELGMRAALHDEQPGRPA